MFYVLSAVILLLLIALNYAVRVNVKEKRMFERNIESYNNEIDYYRKIINSSYSSNCSDEEFKELLYRKAIDHINKNKEIYSWYWNSLEKDKVSIRTKSFNDQLINFHVMNTGVLIYPFEIRPTENLKLQMLEVINKIDH